MNIDISEEMIEQILEKQIEERVNHAMRRYATDEEVDKANREVMEQMLEVEPLFYERV